MFINPSKPIDAINRLINILSPLGKTTYIPRGRKVALNNNNASYVYVIFSGRTSLNRKIDNLLITSENGPSIFGLSEMLGPLNAHTLQAETRCLALKINSIRAKSHIEKHNLWKDVTKVLVFYTSIMLHRDMIIVNQRTFNTVCYFLLEIDLLPTAIRRRINIIHYIQCRTDISRSSILNAITSLKKDRLIHLERGAVGLDIYDRRDLLNLLPWPNENSPHDSQKQVPI